MIFFLFPQFDSRRGEPKVIWLNIAKFEIYLRYRYCSNLFRGMRKESEFRQHRYRNLTKVWERKWKSGRERECMNFGNVITEIPAARLACPSVCVVCSKWDVLKKKTNCGNTIAEIGEEKKIVVTEIWRGIKKISATSIIFLQHFHNKSHVISYY